MDMDDEITKSLESYFEGDNMNEFASIVADKIADRDGMQQLVSEEVENQGVNAISTADAVQSMIDTSCLSSFADSLEVMVSAKLDINKYSIRKGADDPLINFNDYENNHSCKSTHHWV